MVKRRASIGSSPRDDGDNFSEHPWTRTEIAVHSSFKHLNEKVNFRPSRLLSAVPGRLYSIARAPSFLAILLERPFFVVNKAFPAEAGIFIEFSTKPRRAGNRILNEIQGLPIV
jgi:hypothetical protein